MNSAKPPPPPPHRPGTSRPPPPPLRASKPPAIPTSAGQTNSHAHSAAHEAAQAHAAAQTDAAAQTHEPAQTPGSTHASAPASDAAHAHAHAAAHEPSQAPVASVPPPVGAQPSQETRLRVSVKLSVRDPNLLLARPLREGEAPPPGTRAAILVLVESAVEPDPRSGGSST